MHDVPARVSLSLALLVAMGCGEGKGPVFIQVTIPPLAYRDEAGFDLAARVRDDRMVKRVEAVVLDSAALSTPELVDGEQSPLGADPEEYRYRLPMEHVDSHTWRVRLPLPESGDLYFYLEAEDEDGHICSAPGSERGRQLYLVPVLDRAIRPPDVHDPCFEVLCPTGLQCHPQTGECLVEHHCLLPGNGCPPDFECEASSGRCLPTHLCAGVRCGAGEVCDPSSGRCLPEDHCALPGNGCPPAYTCEQLSGRCLPMDPCAQVHCPAGSICDPDTGQCYVPPGELCAPCDHPRQCGGPNDECILYGWPSSQGGCGRDCRTEPCPPKYICQRYGGWMKQCMHSSGSCRPDDWR